MKKQTLIILTMLLIFVGVFLFSVHMIKDPSEHLLVHDVGRIYSAHIEKIVKENQTVGLVETIKNANINGFNVSIAGRQHSQGGHTYYDGAVLLDMKEYNEILDLDTERKIVTVQSGATWEDLQEYLNSHNLSIKVMQSSNIFTVGGSLSANAHGRDPQYGPIIETVQSFRLLLANGNILNVSRIDNSDLFGLVIGGYGLFGVILDVDLRLTDNLPYEKETVMLDYTQYPSYFAANVSNNSSIGLHFARLSISPKTFLRETYATSYYRTSIEPTTWNLEDEKNIARDKFLYGLSRKYNWGKELRWNLQKDIVDKPGEAEFITRNNAMRPPIAFLEHYSEKDTDILQEYYIPIENFTSFTDSLREILKENEVNLLSVTIRYVPADNESFMSYSNKESFAFVLAINHGLSKKEIKKAEGWTQTLVDTALEHGGTYYLTYQLYPSQEQIRIAYPQIQEFFLKKQQYDPNQIFMNKFYAKYALGEESE